MKDFRAINNLSVKQEFSKFFHNKDKYKTRLHRQTNKRTTDERTDVHGDSYIPLNFVAGVKFRVNRKGTKAGAFEPLNASCKRVLNHLSSWNRLSSKGQGQSHSLGDNDCSKSLENLATRQLFTRCKDQIKKTIEHSIKLISHK